MTTGDVILAKSIEHRAVVEVKTDKHGRERVTANRFGFKFQQEHDLMSKVGVFLFLGTYAESNGAEKAYQFAERQLKRLGWKSDHGTNVTDDAPPVSIEEVEQAITKLQDMAYSGLDIPPVLPMLLDYKRRLEAVTTSPTAVRSAE